MSAKTRPRQLTERDRQNIERQLAYEHQPRSVRHDDLQRLARVDENAITKEVRAREATAQANAVALIVERIAGIEDEFGEVRTMIRNSRGLDRRRYRNLDNVRRALAHLREGLTDSN